MLTVLIQSLVLASAGLLSVGSITLTILLLMSDRGLRNGFAYMVGYVGVYSLIGVSAILIGNAVAETSAGETGGFLPWLFIMMGILLLWLAQRNWRKPRSENSENPRLFSLVDKITPPKAFAFGAVVTVINFKNLALFLTAVSVPLVSNLPLPSKIIIVLLVALIFCTSVIAPVFIYILFPKRANKLLVWTKQTLETHSRPIGIWVPLLFSLIFLTRGITGLL